MIFALFDRPCLEFLELFNNMSAFMSEDSPQISALRSLNISERDAKQLEYLRKLQERNRLKKQLVNQSKSKDTIRNERLERGFQLHIRGGNAVRARGQQQKHRGSVGTVGPVKATHKPGQASSGNCGRKRRGWNIGGGAKPKDANCSTERATMAENAPRKFDADAFPFSSERAVDKRPVRDGPADILEDSLLDDSREYSDESFEAYDGEDDRDNEDHAVMDIFHAVRDSGGGYNAIRQSLSLSTSSPRPDHANNKNIARAQSAGRIHHRSDIAPPEKGESPLRKSGTLRPVSAHTAPPKKKDRPLSSLDRPDEVRALATAMARENIDGSRSTLDKPDPKNEVRVAFKAPVNGKPFHHAPIETITQDAAQQPVRESNDVVFKLFDRVNGLSREQQLKLLDMLENMEDGKAPETLPKGGATGGSTDETDHRPSVSSGSETGPDFVGKEPAPTPSPAREEDLDVPTGYILSFRALSNWGARDVIGLTEIEVFDEALQRIEIDPSWITAHGAARGSSAVQDIKRLVNSRTKTTNQRDMWLCPISPRKLVDDFQGCALEFHIEFPRKTRVGKVILWNYNRSMAMSSAGIKGIELAMDGRSIWSGDLHRAHGNKMFNYSTPIAFVDIGAPSVESTKRSKETVEEKSVLPQRKPRLPIETLTFRRFTGNAGNSTITLKEEVVSSTAEQSASASRSNASNSVTDAEIMYEVGRAVANQHEQGTPIWLKGGGVTSSDVVKARQHVPEVDSRDSSKRRKACPRNRVEETKHKRQSKSTNDQHQPEADADQDVLETSFDSLAHFERNNLSRLNKLSVSKDFYSSETTEPLVEANISSSQTESGELPPTPELEGAFSGVGVMLSELERTGKGEEGKQTTDSAIEECINYRAPERFAIPQLPSGRKLKMVIKSTWGDPHYVGLSGIEVFDGDGAPIALSECSLSANPPDINVLPEYDSDPRTIDKLIDGNNHTSDDMHVWLAPFSQGGHVEIEIDFMNSETLSMIRIWNYNKSRIHSYRGARWVQLFLDEAKIFDGEVKKAPGNLLHSHQCAEVILFTFDDDILAMIEAEDRILESEQDATVDLLSGALSEFAGQRPGTGDKTKQVSDNVWRTTRATTPEHSYEQVFKETHGHRSDSLKRPKTGAFRAKEPSSPLRSSTLDSLLEEFEVTPEVDPVLPSSSTHVEKVVNIGPPPNAVRGKVIDFSFLTTWGDPHFMGLTGIEVLVWQPQMGGLPFKVVPLAVKNLTASPSDINIGGHSGDPRTLDKLLDTMTHTMDDRHMWLIPYTKGGKHTLQVRLGEEMVILGLRIWNYNKSADNTYRGVRDVVISVDGKPVFRRFDGPGAIAARLPPFSLPSLFQFRKAPGNLDVDFGQTILFQTVLPKLRQLSLAKEFVSPLCRQDYETQANPCGHVFRFSLLATWGDPYYIGLDRLELFDESGNRIPVRASQITAAPHSINVLDEAYAATEGRFAEERLAQLVEYDRRVPSNLAMSISEKPICETSTWLAPLTTSMENSGQCPNPNYVYFSFDYPVAISMVKIWNYSKSPLRGASSLEISVDDNLIYKGDLAQAGTLKNPYQVILFSNDESVIRREASNVHYCGSIEQSVLCINEREIMGNSAHMYAKSQAQRGVGAYTFNKHEEPPRPKTGMTRHFRK